MEDSKDPDQTLRDINKALDGLDKELREKKRQQLNARFAQGTELLREKGVKEHKIQEGIKAAYETARRARDTPSDDPVIISALEDPESPIHLLVEPPGVKLSEVKTQQIDCIWQRRSNLGKITLPDADPRISNT